MIFDREEVRINVGKFVGWRLQTPNVSTEKGGIIADFFHIKALIDFLQMTDKKFNLFLLIWTEKETLEAQTVSPNELFSFKPLTMAIGDGEKWFCEKAV